MGEKYLKLLELLKEVPEIKNDLEELRFGTQIRYGSYVVKFLYNFEGEDFICGKYGLEDGIMAMNRKIDEIIGNPIEERHLRIYLNHISEKENIYYIPYKQKGKKVWYSIVDEEIRKYTEETGNVETYITICELDNSKPFHLQDDEVCKQIYDYFISFKK